MNKFILFLTVIFSILFTSCTIDSPAIVIPTADSSSSITESEKSDPLAATFWLLTGSEDEISSNLKITLDFSKGNAEGFSGCNTYFGLYQTSDNELSIKELKVTMIGCDDDTMHQEEAYLSALETVVRFRITDNVLELLNSSDAPILVYQQKTGEIKP